MFAHVLMIVCVFMRAFVFVRTCLYICVCACVRVTVCVCVHVYMCKCVRVCVYVLQTLDETNQQPFLPNTPSPHSPPCVHVRLNVCMWVCAYIHVNGCVSALVHACLLWYLCASMHVFKRAVIAQG